MGADPDWFIEKKLAKTKQGLSFFDKDALAEYKRCFRNPETIHAICEDYRAASGIDLDMDTKDFEAGRKIECPVLLLWGATGGVGRNHKPGPAEIWQRYASNIVAAKALPCGHYLSEEAPAETTAALREFFSGVDRAITSVAILCSANPSATKSRFWYRDHEIEEQASPSANISPACQSDDRANSSDRPSRPWIR